MSLIDATIPLYKLCNAMLTKISLLIPPIKWVTIGLINSRKGKKIWRHILTLTLRFASGASKCTCSTLDIHYGDYPYGKSSRLALSS